MRKLIEFLRQNLDHPNLNMIDKQNMQKTVGDFDFELSKVCEPQIVEK